MVAPAHPRTHEPERPDPVPGAAARAGAPGTYAVDGSTGDSAAPAAPAESRSAEPRSAESQHDGAGLRGAVPALLAAYRDLTGVRHDYPALLSSDDTRPVVAPLAAAVDAAIATATADGTHPGARVAAYRAEARVVRVVDAWAADREPASLGNLWRSAVDALERETRDPDRRMALAADLAAVTAALPGADALLPCRAQTPAAVVTGAWRRRRRDLARAATAALDDLIGRVTDAVAADVAGSPSAVTVDALQASVGAAHGVDLSALSAILGGSHRYRDPAPARTTRLQDALAALQIARGRLATAAPVGPAGHGAHEAVPAATCRRAFDAWSQDVARRVEMVRAVRIATLELQNRYRPERHDALFAAFGVDQLTGEERRAISPLLVSLDADALDPAEQSLLLEILASDMPIKVFLAVRSVPGLAAADGHGAAAEWPVRIAEIAAALGEAYVIQAPMSLLPRLAEPLEAAFEHAGPALVAVYAPADDTASSVPPYIRAAAAAEARLFPGFVSDPTRGSSATERLTLVGNVQQDRVWPIHRLAYEDADGRPVEDEAAFTAADFLALDERFWPHFRLDGTSRANGRTAPVADHLATDRPTAPDAAPFISIVGADDRLYQAAVGADVITYARRTAARWARLRDLGTPRVAVTTPAPGPADASPAAPASTGSGATAASLPGPSSAGGATPMHPDAVEAAAGTTDAGAASAAGAPAAASPAPAAATVAPPVAPAPASATAPPDEAASIDSAMCTACNECTQRNNRMFAYNDAKQAYVKDARAGTYRELVEAAETCPVCIIHPGRPLDPAEPGLDDLVARAAAFA